LALWQIGLAADTAAHKSKPTISLNRYIPRFQVNTRFFCR